MKINRTQAFYRRGIKDAFLNFERDEITISHAFRRRHAFLSGRTYGEALYSAVRREAGCFQHALEIGCGLGDLAHGFLRAWRRDLRARAERYTLLDISRRLQAAQRRRLRPFARLVRFRRGDAQKFPFPAKSLEGVVICNETINVLNAREVSVGDRAFAALLDRWDLRGRIPWRRFIFPTGLAALLERLARASAAGTHVVLIDYFDLTGRGGRWVSLPGHQECALDVDLVCHIARRAGFSVKVEPLASFLGLRVSEPVATEHFVSFLVGTLRYRFSPSVPWTRREISRRLGRRWSAGLDAFFECGEIVRRLSAFRAIRLTKHRDGPSEIRILSGRPFVYSRANRESASPK